MVKNKSMAWRMKFATLVCIAAALVLAFAGKSHAAQTMEDLWRVSTPDQKIGIMHRHLNKTCPWVLPVLQRMPLEKRREFIQQASTYVSAVAFANEHCPALTAEQRKTYFEERIKLQIVARVAQAKKMPAPEKASVHVQLAPPPVVLQKFPPPSDFGEDPVDPAPTIAWPLIMLPAVMDDVECKKTPAYEVDYRWAEYLSIVPTSSLYPLWVMMHQLYPDDSDSE